MRTGFINPYVHVNITEPSTAPPCHDCGSVVDDYYTEPNRCAGCHGRHCADLLNAADGGQVYRDTAGILRRQGEPLVEDDAAFLEPLIDCPPGRTAHLNEAGRASAWRRPAGATR
jgi:hypothetical protein